MIGEVGEEIKGGVIGEQSASDQQGSIEWPSLKRMHEAKSCAGGTSPSLKRIGSDAGNEKRTVEDDLHPGQAQWRRTCL